MPPICYPMLKTCINQITIDDNMVLGFQELMDTGNNKNIFLGVLVYAISSNKPTHVSAGKLTATFSLSSSEAQVCHLLSAVETLKSIARLEEKSTHTVREKFNNAFKKTGCSSQVSLINLLANIPN